MKTGDIVKIGWLGSTFRVRVDAISSEGIRGPYKRASGVSQYDPFLFSWGNINSLVIDGEGGGDRSLNIDGINCKVGPAMTNVGPYLFKNENIRLLADEQKKLQSL